MLYSVKLQVTNPTINPRRNHSLAGPAHPDRFPYDLRLPARRRRGMRVLSVKSESSIPTRFTATVGAPSLSPSSLQLSQWNLTQKHVVLLNIAACSVTKTLTPHRSLLSLVGSEALLMSEMPLVVFFFGNFRWLFLRPGFSALRSQRFWFVFLEFRISLLIFGKCCLKNSMGKRYFQFLF